MIERRDKLRDPGLVRHDMMARNACESPARYSNSAFVEGPVKSSPIDRFTLLHSFDLLEQPIHIGPVQSRSFKRSPKRLQCLGPIEWIGWSPLRKFRKLRALGLRKRASGEFRKYQVAVASSKKDGKLANDINGFIGAMNEAQGAGNLAKPLPQAIRRLGRNR